MPADAASIRLDRLRAVPVAALGGFALAMLIVAWPLPGMVAPLALGATILFVRQPQWLMLVFFASLAVPIQRTVAGLPVNAADALLVLWCVLWPLMIRRSDGPGFAGWRLPVLVTMVAPFILAVGASQIGSINPGASFKQVLRIIEWFVVLPILMSALVPDARFRRFAGTALMVVPCLFAIDGIFEYFNNGRRLTEMIGIPVPVPEGGTGQIRHTFDVSGRAGSSFGGAQGLAMYLVMTMGFALAHLVHARERWMRRLALICLVISMAGLGVAQSRGGLLGAVALLTAMALVTRPSLRVPVLFLVVFVSAIGLVVLGLWPSWDGTISGLVPGRPEAVLDRLIIWGKVVEVMWDHPFTGVGLGNFRDAFFAREPWLHVDLAYPSLHAHNTYLELLADTGWFGLIAYLAFLVMVARRLTSLWSTGERPVLTLGAIGSLAAYSVFAMVDMLLLQNMHFLLVLVLSIGLCEAGRRTPAVEKAAAREGHR